MVPLGMKKKINNDKKKVIVKQCEFIQFSGWYNMLSFF